MSWFRNMRVSIKLVLGFLCMAALIIIIGFFGLHSLGKMNNSLSNMYDNNLVPVRDLSHASISYQRIRVSIWEVLLIEQSTEQREKKMQEIAEYSAEVDRDIKQYQATSLNLPEQQGVDELISAWESYKETMKRATTPSTSAEAKEATLKAQMDLAAVSEKVRGALDSLIEMKVNLATEGMQEGDQLFENSRNTTFIAMVIAVLLSFIFGLLFSRSISNPLQRVVRLVDKVSKGDLTDTVEVTAKDEIGQLTESTNEMILSLRGIVGGVATTAEGVSAAAQQISASTEEIAGGSSGQAHAAQTINELFKELTAATHAVAQIAEQASDISEDTMDIAEQGGKVVRSSVEGMNQVNVHVTKLEEDSNRIGEIIEVIDDIAEQTNLLALNAAIEAARAGDQGRGFAVVADEVRKLAERSGEATKQITNIIKGMQENTRQSVKATRDGVELSKQTGEAFENIISKVNESASKVTEIAAASQQQAAQSVEVMAAVENISAVTEESAASCEETASAAQSLAGLAEELNHSISVFKVNS